MCIGKYNLYKHTCRPRRRRCPNDIYNCSDERWLILIIFHFERHRALRTIIAKVMGLFVRRQRPPSWWENTDIGINDMFEANWLSGKSIKWFESINRQRFGSSPVRVLCQEEIVCFCVRVWAYWLTDCPVSSHVTYITNCVCIIWLLVLYEASFRQVSCSEISSFTNNFLFKLLRIYVNLFIVFQYQRSGLITRIDEFAR